MVFGMKFGLTYLGLCILRCGLGLFTSSYESLIDLLFVLFSVIYDPHILLTPPYDIRLMHLAFAGNKWEFNLPFLFCKVLTISQHFSKSVLNFYGY